MYIQKASTISFQPTFGRTNFYSELKPVTIESAIVHPNYIGLIPPMALRRMTDIIRMSIGCAKACLTSENENKVGGIIVGTALGSSNHTQTFMDKIKVSEGRLISPTSFILSTHNTMAGQISLNLNCVAYNNTHSHNSLSFENSLLDCMLLIEEGKRNILIGTSDEANEKLFSTRAKLGSDRYPAAYGASFFLVDRESPKSNGVKFIDVDVIYAFEDITITIEKFLVRNNVATDTISKVYYSTYVDDNKRALDEIFGVALLETYETLSGSYLSASSFAAHLAFDFLSNNQNAEYVLVVNNMLSKNLGLTLLKRD